MLGSILVIAMLIFLRMVRAVQLDHEPAIDADKVEDMASQRILPAKLEAVQLSPAKCLPEDAFGRRLPDAELACGRNQFM
ncbi:MAG TPA: hypothetical protein VFP05_07340 [Thermomicrobiales bacterium]|nr:hypothetical protein [Thermomicrobiales bacterium]